MSVVIICPQCGAVSKGRDDLVGKTVRCPKCAKTFTVPPEELQEIEVVTPSPPPPASKNDTVAQSVKCPSCNTHDVKKVSFVYEQEMKNVDVSTEAMGVGVGTGGVSVFGGSVPTQGTIASILAQRISPPSKPHDENNTIVGCLGVLTIGGFFNFVIILIARSIFGDSEKVMMTVVAISLVVSMYEAWKIVELSGRDYKKRFAEAITEYEAALDKWNRSLIYYRCGHIFEP